MKFPKLISVKDFLISPSSGTFDKKKFILKAYEIFSNDFKEDNVLFEGNPVLIRDKILDCTVCNNSCGNDFCTCNDCPWKGKEDIFQHLTSDKDPNMEQRLTKNAKQKQRKMRKTNPRYEIRTPGIFSKTRTNRIAWIKFMIENSNDSNISVHISRHRKNEDKIKLYNKKEDYLVIFSRITFNNGTQEFYINSAYHKPYISLLRDFCR